MTTPSTPAGPVADLSAEDAKLVTLARGARLRAYGDPDTAQGAAIRDSDGRTYAAASVAHATAGATTSALRAAYAAAVSSGAREFEAVAVVSADASAGLADAGLLADLAGGLPVILAGPDGVTVGATTIAAG